MKGGDKKMMKTYAMVVGVVLLLVGILGFTPLAVDQGNGSQLILGLILANPAQHLIHILTGGVALFVAFSSRAAYLRSYVLVFGAVYALVALWGLPVFMAADGVYRSVLFGLIHVNVVTEMIHILLAVGALYVALSSSKTAATA
jgi:hypothetical protein